MMTTITGFTCAVQDTKTVYPFFTPTQEGLYEFELTVNDGQVWSKPRRVRVTVILNENVFQETLTVTDNGGATGSASVTITVTLPLDPDPEPEPEPEDETNPDPALEDDAANDIPDKTLLRISNNIIKSGSNSVVTINCDVKEPSKLTVKIYDSKGKEIITLWNGHKEAVTHPFPWKGVDAGGSRVS